MSLCSWRGSNVTQRILEWKDLHGYHKAGTCSIIFSDTVSSLHG